jgi:hypothetical protein
MKVQSYVHCYNWGGTKDKMKPLLNSSPPALPGPDNTDAGSSKRRHGDSRKKRDSLGRKVSEERKGGKATTVPGTPTKGGQSKSRHKKNVAKDRPDSFKAVAKKRHHTTTDIIKSPKPLVAMEKVKDKEKEKDLVLPAGETKKEKTKKGKKEELHVDFLEWQYKLDISVCSANSSHFLSNDAFSFWPCLTTRATFFFPFLGRMESL